jgi:hypothetical protein
MEDFSREELQEALCSADSSSTDNKGIGGQI